jgi:GT2 family glycosyltransferase
MLPETRLAFVVATKDRPEELARMWRSLLAQTRPPRQVVIVDAGTGPLPMEASASDGIVLRHVRVRFASAAGQRNLGLAAVDPAADLIGFLDDDVVLETTAVEEMLRFWTTADRRVGGAAFNLANHPALALSGLKRTSMAEAFGLYARRRGAVTPAGFQTMIERPLTTAYTDWLPSTAAVWRKEVFSRFRFDEWFTGYSYLEDLDFSYRVGKAYRLAVVASARCVHFPAPSGRGSGYAFGLREVVNRVYFVKKNPELSLPKCYLALCARALMSLGLSIRGLSRYQLQRVAGNAAGLAACLAGFMPVPLPTKGSGIEEQQPGFRAPRGARGEGR